MESPLTEGTDVRKADNGIVVLDFETSGLSPDRGDRAIEIGAVLIRDGKIADHFQSLINPGFPVSGLIEAYTGISNEMLQKAPEAPLVMDAFYDFIGGYPLVAHNAAFDRRFLDAELQRIRKQRQQDVLCSLLVARRLYPGAPNHKLETLVRYKGLPPGTFHRALADAEMTAHLWLRMVEDMVSMHGVTDVTVEVMQQFARLKKSAARGYLERLSGENMEKDPRVNGVGLGKR